MRNISTEERILFSISGCINAIVGRAANEDYLLSGTENVRLSAGVFLQLMSVCYPHRRHRLYSNTRVLLQLYDNHINTASLNPTREYSQIGAINEKR